MTEKSSSPTANVHSAGYYIARTRAPCGRCGRSTLLLALAVPAEHSLLDPEEDSWQPARISAFLFYVGHVSSDVERVLAGLSATFRRVRSAATLAVHWVNHCEHCGGLLDDHELHCEPQGAFLPSSEADAAAIELSHIDASFEAAADGYSCDPPFFGAMRRC